ncbi:hypothetical protein ACPUER_36715 [Burkholderia sp. DN3021]|uniref:hypothetical protein n=1 Tax=Burkholderia sp. DN3021 TaxID=3410137 RepID=UPI003C7BFAC6
MNFLLVLGAFERDQQLTIRLRPTRGQDFTRLLPSQNTYHLIHLVIFMAEQIGTRRF